jgi:hypothetical protein
MVDYDIFQNVKKADLKDFSRVFARDELDFRLRPNAVAVDAGCVLPSVSDGFVGKAPDLGALEVGQPQPIWGQRPQQICGFFERGDVGRLMNPSFV